MIAVEWEGVNYGDLVVCAARKACAKRWLPKVARG